MATKQMNMHRLLAELKMLDKRINGYMPSSRDSRDFPMIGAARVSDAKIGTQTREEYTSSLVSNWQTIQALIRNKKTLEAAKVKSNAETTVRIAGKEYTVADAIRRKADIRYDKALLAALEAQRQLAITAVADHNEEAELQADKHVEALLGGAGAKSEALPAKEIERQRESFLKNRRWDVIDPNGADAIIKAMREDIEAFEAEVDAVLSESNAITMVTVNLED